MVRRKALRRDAAKGQLDAALIRKKGAKGKRTPAAPGGEWMLWPREHGAWSILLLPMVSALAISKTFTVAAAASLIAAVALLLAREPVIVLLRQRLVWKEARPETAVAKRSLKIVGRVLAVAGGVMLVLLPAGWVVLLGCLALALMAGGAWIAVKNRQRTVAWQAGSAVALSGGCLAAAFAATESFPWWAWTLWLLFSLHHVGAVFLVHARLEEMIAAREEASGKPRPASPARRDALLAQAPLGLAAFFYALWGEWWLALPPVVSLVAHLQEWKTLRATLHRPLRQVGFRALGVSVVFAVLVMFALGRG